MPSMTVTCETYEEFCRVIGALNTLNEANKDGPQAPKPRAPRGEAKAAAEPEKAPVAPKSDLFEKVKDLTTDLSKISRDTAVAVLRQYGASSAATLKPEQYADYMKTAKEVLEVNKNSADLL